jgi:hypothetical protein
MTTKTGSSAKQRVQHGLAAFALMFISLFVSMLADAYGSYPAALWRSLLAALAVSLPIGALAAAFGAKVVGVAKAFFMCFGI